MYLHSKKLNDSIKKSVEEYTNRKFRNAEKYKQKAIKAEFAGNSDKAVKYYGKASKSRSKAFKSKSDLERLVSQSKLLDKKISDIDTGKAKAGRDFITYKELGYPADRLYVIERDNSNND